MPHYNSNPTHILSLQSNHDDIYNMIFLTKFNLLVGGCEKGLCAWEKPLKHTNDSQDL